MSYILNALRKSEQARQNNQSPSLENRILNEPQPQSNWGRWLFLALIIVNILFVLIFWLNRDQPGLSSKEETTKTQTLEPPKAIVKPFSNRAKNHLTIVRPSKTSPSITLMDTKSERYAANIHPPISDLIESESFKTKVKPVNKPRTQSLPKTSAQLNIPAPQKIIAEPILKSKPETGTKAANTDIKIPFLSDFPYEFRRNVPKLNINVYVFSEIPSERFVMINMVKYKTGQTMDENIKIIDILKKSLVVKYQNKTFQIQRP